MMYGPDDIHDSYADHLAIVWIGTTPISATKCRADKIEKNSSFF